VPPLPAQHGQAVRSARQRGRQGLPPDRSVAHRALRRGRKPHPEIIRAGFVRGISAHQLERAFQRLLGITPRQYADAQRMQRLKTQLRKGDDVTTALYDAGFGSSSRLYERAPEQLGMTPATYRRGGKGMQISYTIVASPLGRLLVAATQRGISALYLGEDDAKLEAELAKEYPTRKFAATETACRTGCARYWRTCAGKSRISRSLPTCRPPLSNAECGRSCGAYRTAPHAPIPRLPARSANPRRSGRWPGLCDQSRFDFVPCHRVVREDGNLAGYRWGLDRKKSLQERERRLHAAPKN
jgi:AraC family transcriptional regulator of adaptative response/methylated-DNA-[protein]-cysteine methyltransferase